MKFMVNIFQIGNENIKCLESVGIFATISKDYLNFKNLSSSTQNEFRPIACVNPEIEVICYVILLSNGFKNAKVVFFYYIFCELNIFIKFEYCL